MSYFKSLLEMGYDRLEARDLTKLLRNTLAERQNWRCCYCGKIMQNIKSSKHDFSTLEHVVPISLGGPNTESNLVIACASCNSSRSNNFLDVHIELHGMYKNGILT